MVYKISDNILSPIGKTTEENFQSVMDHVSALQLYQGKWDIPEDFMASLFNESQLQEILIDGYSRFESMAIKSATEAIAHAGIDSSTDRVVFIISTTKGDIELLEKGGSKKTLGETSVRIASYLGIKTKPIVTCNACISGVSAIILANRLLETNRYDYAVVVGCDCQCKFIISGFQCLKALSQEKCRPFDIERLGLNLGEAASTIVLSRKIDENVLTDNYAWTIVNGAIRNDAFHISGLSKTAEGAYRALCATMDGVSHDSITMINAHGTATMYNDQMESIAIQRAGLSDIPLNALKGTYGHTMGASGILESVLTMYALDNNILLGTNGYDELGVSGKVAVNKENVVLNSHNEPSFIKMISGFGGANGAILFSKYKVKNIISQEVNENPIFFCAHKVRISNNSVSLDNETISVERKGKELITELYHRYFDSYPKFFKMDMLARICLVASEMVLSREYDNRFIVREDRAVILFNQSSSINTDINYQRLIADKENYYPSPSAFVYTLPNIGIGEIAIRNHYFGETCFYIIPDRDDKLMNEIINATFQDKHTQSIITGWIDCENEDKLKVDLDLLIKK